MMRRSIDDERLLHEAFDWRERLETDAPASAVRRDFQLWLARDYRHEEAFERAKTYVAAFDNLKADDLDPKHLEPLPVEQFSYFLNQIKSAFSTSLFRISAAAAALALIVGPALFLAISSETSDPTQIVVAEHSTDKTQLNTITLSDGTVVTLDASTTITTAMTDTARKVTLSGGAAHFDITPDATRPFSVFAGDLKATAKGTEFDVRSNGGVYRVAVAEGSVEVSFPYILDDGQTSLRTRQLLEAGEQVAATNETGLRRKASIAVRQVGAWRESILLYDGATLGEMIADANRFSEREIVLSASDGNLSNRQISGSFRADDVPGMLSMMSLGFDVSIDESDPARVVISAAPDAAG
ncbi:MAG: FecR domain-containing protein [Pseudomonadota bacterium]